MATSAQVLDITMIFIVSCIFAYFYDSLRTPLPRMQSTMASNPCLKTSLYLNLVTAITSTRDSGWLLPSQNAPDKKMPTHTLRQHPRTIRAPLHHHCTTSGIPSIGTRHHPPARSANLDERSTQEGPSRQEQTKCPLWLTRSCVPMFHGNIMSSPVVLAIYFHYLCSVPFLLLLLSFSYSAIPSCPVFFFY